MRGSRRASGRPIWWTRRRSSPRWSRGQNDGGRRVDPALFRSNERWAKERRTAVVGAVRKRLGELAAALDGLDHLVGSFSAADVVMTTVLRILRHTDLLEQPALVAYKERCRARPAFAKALAGQMAAFS